ncbi:hypothetical protein EK904_013306 [Melospiza melodia maxima]|nr:hypothetical protein EK904_013306 [Melospiza melodia maxima]
MPVLPWLCGTTLDTQHLLLFSCTSLTVHSISWKEEAFSIMRQYYGWL